MSSHCVGDVIALFDDVFYREYNTRLIHADSDPEYLPADAACTFNRIAFAHGFFSSALHEIAHWCIAGEERRKLVDFGYWYAPDGRNAEQQRAFYSVEVKPQALEWMFSVAAGIGFRVSTDNLDGDTAEDQLFEANVYKQVQNYLASSPPKRAQQWCEALAAEYGTEQRWRNFSNYQLPETV